ncbi:MAG TPA: hypothetical protein VNZ26_08230 [Vicinamibacterales bacterium]|jgi:hypothetical protein|nr:hypothetical protein [Vicinamibacterales bacterium]
MTEPIISAFGGTGAQGGGVVDALLAARRFKVRVSVAILRQESGYFGNSFDWGALLGERRAPLP